MGTVWLEKDGEDLFLERLSRRSFLLRGAGFGGVALSAPALAALVSACGGEATGDKPTSGGLLKATINAEPDVLDPALATTAVAAQVYNEIFDKLVDVSPDGKVVPELATKWEMQDDRTWVFTLRDGVTFHNGERLTPSDVKFTFDRILDPKTASSYSRTFGELEGVEELDATRVAFHHKRPFGPFLNALASSGQIVNRRAIEDGESKRKPVGTGAFQLVDWTRGEKLTLKRHGKYRQRGLPYLDDVVMLIRSPAQSNIDALRSGELHYLDVVPTQAIAGVSKDSAFNFVTSDKAGLPKFLTFGVGKEPTNNKALRQAIAWTIDREAVRNVAFFGSGEIGSQEVPMASPWYSDNDPYRNGPDLERARSLMAASGLESPVQIEYLSNAAREDPRRVGEVIRDQLKEIGVDLKITMLEQSVWLERIVKQDYGMTFTLTAKVADPDNVYSRLFVSDAPLNITGYSNPHFDKLITAARSSLDDGTRQQLYGDARAILFEDVPVFFTFYEHPTYLVDDSVLGATASPSLELHLEQIGFAA